MSNSQPSKPNQEPSPSAQLTQMIFGFIPAQAIATAAKLGIADLLKDGPRSVDDLAQASGTHRRSLYRLLRALASVGVFAEDADGVFRLTPVAEFLRSDVPGSLRAFSIYFGADFHLRVWEDLWFSVTHGQPVFNHIHKKGVFEYFEQNSEHAKIFNDAMTSFSASVSEPIVNAYDFSGVGKLADVGGGQGLLLSAILKKYPAMKGILYDAGSVVAGAKNLLVAQGVSERCELVAGDFFDSAPAAGAYIMKHIIHDWEDEKAIGILRNCRQAMTGNGKVLVVEMVVPEGNTPSPSKFLDLEMLIFLHSYERTEKEYAELFEKAGFRLTRVVPTESPYSIVEGVPA
jgi:hypothetical protein